MRAVSIDNFVKSWDDLRIVEVPKPELKPGHAIVKIKVASANPVENPLAHGHLAANGWKTPFPYILGEDFSGMVESIAEDVHNVSVGDPVFAMNWGQSQPHDTDPSHVVGGAFAEFISIPAHKLSKIPPGMSFETAAGLGVVGTTAHDGVVRYGKTCQSTKALMFGGSSSVGIVAVQLAKALGAHVTTTCSSRTLEFVSTLGADKVINYTQTKWEEDEELKQGVDLIFDTVGEKDGLKRAIASGVAKEGGVFVTTADFSVGFDPKAHPPLAWATAFSVKQNAQAQDELAAFIAEGKIQMSVEDRYPFTNEGVIRMLKHVDSGKSVGKNLLIIS
jgi:NADPH:quinone reductase-like Zn-dependent oxidoreductase